VRLLNKEKGSSISGFDVPPRSAVNPTAKVETAGGGQEEGEGYVKTNEERDPEEEHEDNGDYEAESSPARRRVNGKRKFRVPGKVKVAPPPPATVPPTTTTASLVNAILGEEDVTVKINNTVVPLCSPIPTTRRRTMGRTKRRMEMERPSRTGRKTRRSDGSGVWTFHWDRTFGD